MFTVNFRQQGNGGNFYERWMLLADDDQTPIQNDQCIIRVQMWARSARGAGDQSQYPYAWPQQALGAGSYGSVPAFSAATNDGTGVLTLYDGVLTLNVPAATMQSLIPGYYEVGMLISTADDSFTTPLAVGTVPIYNSGVWNFT